MQAPPPPIDEEPAQDGPPVFSTWTQVYAFVLLLHLGLIFTLYWFSQRYAA